MFALLSTAMRRNASLIAIAALLTLSPLLRGAERKHRPTPHHAVARHAAAAARVSRRTEDRVHTFVAAQQRSKTTIVEAPATIARTPHKATAADFLRFAETPQSEATSPVTAQVPEPIQPAIVPSIRSNSLAEDTAEKSAEKLPRLAPQPAERILAEAAPPPVMLPTLYNKRGRLIVPPPLKGSHEILVHQNEVADRDGLYRVQDDADLEEMRRSGELVALPVGAGMRIDERLPLNRRYCRAWTALFLEQLAREFNARFQSPLQVNSAVRTVEFQQRLIHSNGNAAPAEGDTASPHLTGQAIDIAKHGLTLTEIAWLRGYLLPLVQQGKVDVEEEFQQACFHISVYKSYLPPTATPRRRIAAHHAETSTLAVTMP